MNPDRISIALFLFVACFLSACSGRPIYDSPPSQQGTAVPGDAIPRAEPRSRYGNGPLYRVRGKSYTVLDSSHGYQERGVASWYGKKFHGRKTSNQETYNMYAMTAAHKSLPLPTYVRVRNLKNNRSIIVRVNDRGPFIDNRLIDLSYSAALKLDMVRSGTSLVEVTAISFDKPRRVNSQKPATTVVGHRSANQGRAAMPKTPVIREQTPNGNVFVQVGAFGDAGNARKRFAMLKSGGIKTAFVHEDQHASPTLYRVRIGPIANVSQYDSVVEDLQRLGITETHLVTDR